jgi:hypothetical protein
MPWVLARQLLRSGGFEAEAAGNVQTLAGLPVYTWTTPAEREQLLAHVTQRGQRAIDIVEVV